MSSDPIKEVREFLSMNGFPFEMKVAREFQVARFGIHQSVYYRDPISETIRELDVIAHRSERINDHNFNIFF